MSNLDLRRKIIGDIRNKTGISYNLAETSLDIVLDNLLINHSNLEAILSPITRLSHTSNTNDKYLDIDRDGERLKELLSSIVCAKDDSQQRSWSLQEDESIILSQVEEILSLLNEGNITTVKLVMKANEYEHLHNLIVFYQMEPRTSIRLVLLKSFAVLCSWDHIFISELVNSILLLELVRDLISTTDELRISYSVIVLTLIFSTGEAIPLNYYESLNDVFINFVLDGIESSEKYSDFFFKLILSFNLHLQLPENNCIMHQLAARHSDKVLQQTLLLYLNREEDPLQTNEMKNPESINSVMKFLSDIFSCPRTSNLFYTNDMHVLFDIIIRQINDLSPTDYVRIEYTALLQLVLLNSNFKEEMYRIQDVRNCLQQILRDEDNLCESLSAEKKIVQSIFEILDTKY